MAARAAYSHGALLGFQGIVGGLLRGLPSDGIQDHGRLAVALDGALHAIAREILYLSSSDLCSGELADFVMY